jgi:hypothetical protein
MKKQIYPRVVIEDLVGTEGAAGTAGTAKSDYQNDTATSRGSGGFGSTDAKVRIKE